MYARLTLISCLLIPGVGFAQGGKSLPGDAAAERFLKEDTQRVSDRFLDQAGSLEQWQKQLPRLRQEYFDMLGLWPLPERSPLHATITGTVARGEVVIEKLHFQSKPGLYVTGNLYRPRDNSSKLPTILYVCGHYNRGRDGNKTALQEHGMWFARNGYVCLLLDSLQLGEIAGKHHGTYNLGRWWWHSLAYTPAGVECWNGMRALDYLVTRKDVDPDRIGVTGISGGGASTFWIAAADQRVKVAVPVSGMSDLESYISNKVINSHCDCMFLVNLYRWEWTTIAALVAPRPLLFANSDNDRIFPMDGNRRIIARLRQLYKMYGKSDLVEEFVSKGGHDYRPDLRMAVFRWFNQHLKGETGAVKDATDEPLPGKQLRVFPEDTDIPKDARNASIDEIFVTRGKVSLPAAGQFSGWHKEMLRSLQRGPFRNLGTVSAAKPLETLEGRSGQLLATEGTAQAFLSNTVPGTKPGKERTLVVLNEDEASDKALPGWAKRLNLSGEVRLLHPRGVGPTAWTRRNPPNYVERSYALLGRTVDLGRVYDILATWKLLAGSESQGWRLAGRGQAGILAAYAALLDPSIAEVVIVDPPASAREGPQILGILRVLDLPDALGLLAPRKLTLIGAEEKAFERTSEIYKLAGAADKLTRIPASRTRIDPQGVPGTWVVASQPSPSLLGRFAELAGGKKARVAILTSKAEEAPLSEALRPAETVLCKPGPGALRLPEKVTAVWLAEPVSSEWLHQVQKAGLPCGAAGAAAKVLTGLFPDVAVTLGESTMGTALTAGLVHVHVDPEAALVVRGRRLGVFGSGKATIRLASSSSRPARTIELKGRESQDLTALRRAARDRVEGFPPRQVGLPEVPKGTLVIIGGGGMPSGMVDKFVELAGGKEARIVILPTAMPDPLPRERIADSFRKAGAKVVTVLPGRTVDKVESQEYLDAMKQATGVWFGGGRQWRFVDAYEQTRLLPLMHEVLGRGGVIGGSSAGATIQGEYLCRGGVFDNFEIAYEGYERGLAFLPGVAIDQHFAQRNRFKDMSALMKLFPQYLGIGIDEATALIVRGSTAEVVGRGKVHFYDASRASEDAASDHDSLSAGESYDLKRRRRIPSSD